MKKSAAEVAAIVRSLAYYNFRPRPDQPHRHDQQRSFFDSDHPGVTFMLGGNGAGTTTLGLAKMVKFLTSTPPPRCDTPFWVIAESYEQVCNACWKEKLHQQGHLPPQEIDWGRISWYKPNNDWPFSVPLRSPAGSPGRNWQLVFKSYAQGRGKMQAESIGGFLFVEQFPWGLLEEVLRGCREYDFVGNKLAEFTPVDPGLSVNLQEMEETNELPDGWAIYRANTECAMEAGHVKKQWFDQFFGMVPEQMRKVRMMGLWGGFEGAVFPEFDTAIHCLPDNWEIPPACYHRRAIDWGFGVDNAFCCLWMCRNGVGQWFIYDEYYSTDTSKTVVDHLKEISDRHIWPDNPYWGVTWADPSNLNCHRIASRLPEYAPGYESINIQAAANSVDEGLEHMKWLLKPDPALAIDGKPLPRLMIDRRSCPNLLRQFRSYRYVRSSKTGLNPRDAPNEVLKADDHTIDAARYALFSEASMQGITPKTMSRMHSPQSHGVQINSKRLNKSGKRKAA